MCDAIRLLARHGQLILSTSNYNHPLHQAGLDPFDMPPHHLNHFTDKVFTRIADAFGLDLVSTHIQTDRAQKVDVWLLDEHRGLERLVRLGAKNLGSLLGYREIPGHTVLAVMQKRS